MTKCPPETAPNRLLGSTGSTSHCMTSATRSSSSNGPEKVTVPSTEAHDHDGARCVVGRLA